jgi:hypothetical protein
MSQKQSQQFGKKGFGCRALPITVFAWLHWLFDHQRLLKPLDGS